MAEGTSDYRQPRVLTSVLLALVVFQIFSAALVGGVVLAAAIRGENLNLPQPLFVTYDLIRRTLFVTPLTITVVKMFWIYRVNKNTHNITSQSMEYTPGWAVGWHFVPVASIWYPYFVISELYRANRNPETWRSDKAPPIILIWWVLTIISNIAGTIVSFATKGGHTEIPLSASAVLLLSLAAHQSMALFIYSRIAGFQKHTRTIPAIEQVF